MTSNNYNLKQLKESQVIQQKILESNEAKIVVLKPIGYPIECSLVETPLIEIPHHEIFEIYAKEQWIGTKISIGSYIFDQKLIPDFAFQIVDLRPNNSYITQRTSILIMEEKNKKEKPVTVDYKLDDIIGQKRAKNKTKIITRYLEEPEKFNQWAPKNILFYGAPGTGKTMLAQALANQNDIPIKLIKATSLIGDHVGDGANLIHDLYNEARHEKPMIIFIDEIDAIALERKYQSLRGDVTEIVNALLTELDGIINNEEIITIAATNNPQLLDHAIRSRFEEEIEFTLPTTEDRREIIKKNLKTLPLKTNINLESLVTKTKNLSGRDIKEKIIKVALHQALIEEVCIITDKHLTYALNQFNHNNQNDESAKGMFV